MVDSCQNFNKSEEIWLSHTYTDSSLVGFWVKLPYFNFFNQSLQLFVM